MAELCCAICDKEVGYMGQVRLSDGNFICKDCEKRVSPFFEPLDCTINQYFGSIKQNEDGRKLYDAYFANNRKAVRLCDNHVIYDPGTALVCIFGDKGGIFNRSKFYNVFRLADIDQYMQTSRFRRTSDGANSQISCAYISFDNAGDRINRFVIVTDDGKAKKMVREFDRIFGGRAKVLAKSAAEGLDSKRDELFRKGDAAIREILDRRNNGTDE